MGAAELHMSRSECTFFRKCQESTSAPYFPPGISNTVVTYGPQAALTFYNKAITFSSATFSMIPQGINFVAAQL